MRAIAIVLVLAASGCAERASTQSNGSGGTSDCLEFRLTRLSDHDRATRFGEMIRPTGMPEYPFLDALGHRITADDLVAGIRTSLRSGTTPFIFIYVEPVNSVINFEVLSNAVSTMNQVLDRAHVTPENVRVVFCFIRTPSPAGRGGLAKPQ